MYLLCVIAFGTLVHLLLLLCADRFCRKESLYLRTWLAAVVGGIYNGICLYDHTGFIRSFGFRLILLLILGGLSGGQIRKIILFLLLHLALEGIGQDFGEISGWTLLFGAVGVLVLCILPGEYESFLPVELSYKERKVRIMALQDTGNHLLDPVSGLPVLVVDADAAHCLTGLSPQQLRCPVETMGTIPGLRLIPYKAVGGNGLLLGMHLNDVRIGKWRGKRLVAFSPVALSSEGRFQALTGGML